MTNKNAHTDTFSHYPVMLEQSISELDIKENGIYCDMTLGGGGHSEQIARRLRSGRLICIDTDSDAIEAAKKRLAQYGDKIIFVRENFKNVKAVLQQLGIHAADGFLADLGVSSYQLDCAQRGFSYMKDAPLDMRMNRDASLDAYTVVNTYTEEQLKKIIYMYGEESYAPSIARRIADRRAQSPVRTTGELADIIKSAMPQKAKAGGHHPAKRTFQAIRIAVNGELDVIEPALRDAAQLLNPGGRLCVITFHSLEDRIVKTTLADLATGCTCPRDFPVCVCGKMPLVQVLTKKPVLPSQNELEENPRSRSAKLRAARKL